MTVALQTVSTTSRAAGSTAPRWSPAAACTRSSTPPPATSSPRYALATPADVDAAVASARAALRGWAGDPGRAVGGAGQAGDLAGEHADDLVAEEVSQTGKPVRLATEFDVPGSIDNIDFFAGAARHLEGKATAEYSGDHTSSIRREAIGVVATITPWNYPLQMAVWKVLPALAAGCTVVIKPAEITPLTTLTLARLASEAGLPDGVLQRRHRRGRRRRHGAGRASRRRPGDVHRLDRRRPQGDGRGRRARPPHPAGTRRQGAVRGVRRRRPRRRHPGRGRRVADQHRPGLHRRHPRHRRARPVRRLRRRRRRGDEQDRRR